MLLAFDFSSLQPIALAIGVSIGGILVLALSKFLRAESGEIKQGHPVVSAVALSLAEAIDESRDREQILDAAAKKAQARGDVQGVSVLDHLGTVVSSAASNNASSS